MNSLQHHKYSFLILLVFFTVFNSHSTANATGEIDIINVIGPIEPIEKSDIENLFSPEEPPINPKPNQQQNDYVEILKLIMSRKLEQAKTKLAEAYQQHEESSNLHTLSALISHLEKDSDGAKTHLKQALTSEPNNITALLLLAKIYLDTSDYDQAEKNAQAAIYQSKKKANFHLLTQSYLLFAKIRYIQDPVKAEEILLSAQKEVFGNKSSEAKLLKSLGKYYVLTGKPEKILPLATEFHRRYPENNASLDVLASAQIVNNQDDSAIDTLQKIIRQSPSDLRHRLQLFYLYAKKTKYKNEALNLLEEIAKIEPNQPRPYFIKAIYLNNLGKHDEAYRLAEHLDEQFPNFIFSAQLKGDIFKGKKQYKKAFDQYQKAFESYQNDQLAYAILLTGQASKETPKAIELAEEYLNKRKGSLILNLTLASLYHSNNDSVKSEQKYSSLLKDYPDNSAVHNDLAMLYLALDKKDKALKFAENAYKLSPDSGIILDTYGYSLIKNGSLKQGIDLLEKAVAKQPRITEIRLHLADAYILNGEKNKAKTLLDQLLQQPMTPPEKKLALELRKKI